MTVTARTDGVGGARRSGAMSSNTWKMNQQGATLVGNIRLRLCNPGNLWLLAHLR